MLNIFKVKKIILGYVLKKVMDVILKKSMGILGFTQNSCRLGHIEETRICEISKSNPGENRFFHKMYLFNNAILLHASHFWEPELDSVACFLLIEVRLVANEFRSRHT